MRIRSHLLLVTAVVLVPVLLAAGFAVSKVREAERETALRGLRETVRATSLMVDGQIQHSLGSLNALGQSHHLLTGDLAAFYQQAEAIDKPPTVWTLLLDDTGRQLLNTRVPFGTPLPPAAAQARVAQVLATGRPLVSELIVGPLTKQSLTTIYVPAKPSSAGRFVVAQAFSIDHWKTISMAPPDQSKWIVAVIDHSGKFIWRSHRAAEYLGRQARPELVAAAAAEREGMIRHATLEGVDSYDAFTHSALSGWTIAVAAPVSTIEASATQAIMWLATGVATALLLALLAAIIWGRMLMGALATAARAADALGRGELPPAARTAVLEINNLHLAIGRAARLLQEERRSGELIEEQRRQLLENERSARARSEDENRAKDKFLALLGHELRNPLAAIASATEVLARGATEPEARQRFVSVIHRQNGNLRRIVDDLVEVSRMFSGKITLESRPLDLTACVRSCIDALRSADRAQGFRWDLRADEVWVHGDPVRIEQIVNNLVVNAMQFSPSGSEIRIVVAAEVSSAEIEIADSGPGIAPELLPRIFEPFFQGPIRVGGLSGGLGIGLALVKQLVELHGGSIAVRDGVGGVGSTFSVRLARIVRPSEAANPMVAAARRTGRLLIVDDSDDARQSTAELLRTIGYEVAEAADGEAALRSAAASAPDAVILDLGLPGKSGFVVASEMRSEQALQHVPLIALSGYGQNQDRLASSAVGFQAHLVKPVSLDELVAAIESSRSRVPHHL